MAVGTGILKAQGPLPIKAQFSSESDGPVILLISGSVWSTTAGAMIGFNVSLNGTVISENSIYSNGPETHRNVIPTYVTANLSFGTNVLTIEANTAETVSDENDRYNIFMIE